MAFPGCRCPPVVMGAWFRGGYGALRKGRRSGRDLLSESGTQRLRIFNAPNMAALADFDLQNRQKQRRVCSLKSGAMRRTPLYRKKSPYGGARRSIGKDLRAPGILGTRSETCTGTACGQQGGICGVCSSTHQIGVLCGRRRVFRTMRRPPPDSS